MNLGARPGVAVREFRLDTGPVDYLLYAGGKVIGVVEAKPEGRPEELVRLAGLQAQVRGRLREMPAFEPGDLWPVQRQIVENRKPICSSIR